MGSQACNMYKNNYLKKRRTTHLHILREPSGEELLDPRTPEESSIFVGVKSLATKMPHSSKIQSLKKSQW